MAGKGGTIPARERTRRRDNADAKPDEAGEKAEGTKTKRKSPHPPLPKTYTTILAVLDLSEDNQVVHRQVEIEYLDETRATWKIWATSEQARKFSPTDWLTLKRLARLWDQFERTGDPKLAVEIRLTEGKLGATREDRIRLHWVIDSDKDEPKAKGLHSVPSRVAGDPRKGAA